MDQSGPLFLLTGLSPGFCSLSHSQQPAVDQGQAFKKKKPKTQHKPCSAFKPPPQLGMQAPRGQRLCSRLQLDWAQCGDKADTSERQGDCAECCWADSSHYYKNECTRKVFLKWAGQCRQGNSVVDDRPLQSEVMEKSLEFKVRWGFLSQLHHILVVWPRRRHWAFACFTIGSSSPYIIRLVG